MRLTWRRGLLIYGTNSSTTKCSLETRRSSLKLNGPDSSEISPVRPNIKTYECLIFVWVTTRLQSREFQDAGCNTAASAPALSGFLDRWACNLPVHTSIPIFSSLFLITFLPPFGNKIKYYN